MDPIAAAVCLEGRLRLSRAPSAELASAALLAQRDARLPAADFVIVAVPPGEGPALVARLEQTARAAPAVGTL